MDVPVSSYAPDQAPIGAYNRSINNVLPISKTSRGPCKALQAVTEALDARCQGAASMRATDGTARTFGATATKLYYIDPTDGTAWIDATRSSGGAYAVGTESFVKFAKYGDLALSVNGTDAAQKFDISGDTEFTVLAGSPPVFRDIAVWDDYVVGLRADPNDTIQWGGTDDPESWVVGVDNSDQRKFPDSGAGVALTGGRQKLVFLESAIWRATNVGGTDIFQMSQISTERGCVAAGSVASYQDLVFFLAPDGFFMLSDAGLQPIGAQLIDATFWSTVNKTYLSRITATVDPRSKLYRVCYPSKDSAMGLCDKMLVYNWDIQEWTPADYTVEYLRRVVTTTGITLEALDALYPGGLESIPISFDSPAFSSTPEEALAAFNGSHQMGFFDGATLAARLPSQEAQLIPGYKARINSIRPIVDGGEPAEILTSVGVRDNKLNDDQRFTTQVAQRPTGRAPFAAKRTKGRFHMAQTDMLAGANWSNFQGWDYDAIRAGMR